MKKGPNGARQRLCGKMRSRFCDLVKIHLFCLNERRAGRCDRDYIGDRVPQFLPSPSRSFSVWGLYDGSACSSQFPTFSGLSEKEHLQSYLKCDSFKQKKTRRFLRFVRNAAPFRAAYDCFFLPQQGGITRPADALTESSAPDRSSAPAAAAAAPPIPSGPGPGSP